MTTHEGNYRMCKRQVLATFHTRYLSTLLRETGGNVTHAAKLCGMKRSALQRLIRNAGLKSADFRSAALDGAES